MIDCVGSFPGANDGPGTVAEPHLDGPDLAVGMDPKCVTKQGYSSALKTIGGRIGV